MWQLTQRYTQVFLVAAGLCFASASQAQTTWDAATGFADSNIHTKNFRQFAEEVDVASSGKFRINIRSNGSLFKQPEIRRAIQTKQVQMGEIFLGAYGNEDPFFEVDTVPFLAGKFEREAYDDARRLWELSRAQIEERFARTGLMPLYVMPWPGMVLLSTVPIGTVNDFKRLKVRASAPTQARFAEHLGASPTIIAAPEVAQAFAIGAVQAQMVSVLIGADTHAWEYTKTFYAIHGINAKNIILVNRQAFESLSPELRAIVLKAAANAEKRGWEASFEAGKQAYRLLEEKGMMRAQLSQEVMAKFRGVGDVMTEEWIKKAGPGGAKVIDQFRAR